MPGEWRKSAEQEPRKKRTCNWRLTAVACAICFLCQISQAEFGKPLPSLRTLRTTREAHGLSPQNAIRGYPVHLHGVVTYFDPVIDPRHIALFLHDRTGSIFVSVPEGSLGEVRAGTIVDVTGVTGLGDFAPIIAHPSVQIHGRAALPSARRVTLAHLLSGADDGQWVEVEGVVRSVFTSEHNVTLQIGTLDGVVSASAPRETGADYNALVDAKVRVQANAAPLFNGDHQMIGARLLFPNLTALQLLEAAPRDPYALPVRAIESLSRFNPQAGLPHRIHLQGRVTLYWPGSLLCIQDATRGLCSEVKDTTPVALGTRIDLIGFAAAQESGTTLTKAIFKQIPGSTPVVESALLDQKSLSLANEAQVVRIDGELVARDGSASQTVLVLSKGEFLFTAVLPEGWKQEAAQWRNGSHLQVTGVCSVGVDMERSGQTEGSLVTKSFRVLLRSPADVVVLSTPSWWSAQRALLMLGGVLAVTLLVFCWVVVLRRQVREQTEVIRQSEERFRYLAQHDALTGLPTRLLFNERLDAAVERSAVDGDLALLMLDLDNFKSINDMYGHHAGDETLCVTARRLLGSVRKTDTVARMGGDEFIVLLQGIGEPEEAEAIAAKVVSELSQSIRIDGQDVPISVSVGLCKLSGSLSDTQALLKNADHAMYRAKEQGKNCFHTFSAGMTCA